MSIKKKTIIWTGVTATVALISLTAFGIEPFEMEATEIHREIEEALDNPNDLPTDSEGNIIS